MYFLSSSSTQTKHTRRYKRKKAFRDSQIFDDLIAGGFEVMEADSVS
jgi:hypothetical protein